MKYTIFGTGDYYERYKKWFHKNDIVALLDNSPAKQNTFIDGIKVLSPKEGSRLPSDAFVILSFYVKDMREQLLEEGVSEDKIYHFYDLYKLVNLREWDTTVLHYESCRHRVETLDDATISGGEMLLLSQDMMLGGPALAVLQLGKVLVQHGWKVDFASMIDGPLREQILESGMDVIIDNKLQIATMEQLEWTQRYSSILCSTINYHVFLSKRTVNIPVIWWLHDSAFFYEGINQKLLQEMEYSNMKIVSVGPVPADAFHRMVPQVQIGRLLYGVEECACSPHRQEKVTFLTIGYIENRKGQDVLLEAIKLLPQEVLQKAQFYWIGQRCSVMAQQLSKEIEQIPEIIMTGTVDRIQINQYYSEADALICPSREDPMPTVAAEAMMHGVPCIVSSATGTAEYIENQYNGFVFDSEDEVELSQILETCINDSYKLQQIGQRGKEVYDQYFSLDAFEKNVCQLIVPKKIKIAVYGLSTETEKLLPELCVKYHVIGLLDGFREDGQIYGQQIISLENAFSQEVETILVVARPGSCKAIAKRIGQECRLHQVTLTDARGKNLLQKKEVQYDYKAVKGYQYQDLLHEIQKVEVVSFDLFDTLIMRKIVLPVDVIALTEARQVKKGIIIPEFQKRRIEAEKRLSRECAPTLREIYIEVLQGETSPDAEELALLEYETDKNLLIPRGDMLQLMSEAKASNKKVYITTDTYYSREQILELLSSCHIMEYDDVLVSCEYGLGKQQNLFDILIEKVGTCSILHIGDDDVSDICMAKKHGLKAFHIYSGTELFDMAGGLGVADAATSLADQIKVGMLIAKLFNSPFQFEENQKRIGLKDEKEIGYVLCAPMITDFLLWFLKQVQRFRLDNIWFSARDGYLIQKLYTILVPMASTEYFLTSRKAAVRAGIRDARDIAYVDEMRYSGTLQECLKERFGINANYFTERDLKKDASGLLQYTSQILKKTKYERMNYKRYIEHLQVHKGEIGFFDFVAKGTCQLYVNRLVKNQIKGLYFLQLEPEHMKDKDLDILPFYAEEEKEDSSIFDNYYILETILTAPHPSVEEFDDEGCPIYAKETRSKEDIACVMNVQEGIVDYFKDYMLLCPESERRINKKLDEGMLSLVHNLEICDFRFLNLKVEDPFFNRMTNVTDLI